MADQADKANAEAAALRAALDFVFPFVSLPFVMGDSDEAFAKRDFYWRRLEEARAALVGSPLAEKAAQVLKAARELIRLRELHYTGQPQVVSMAVAEQKLADAVRALDGAMETKAA